MKQMPMTPRATKKVPKPTFTLSVAAKASLAKAKNALVAKAPDHNTRLNIGPIVGNVCAWGNRTGQTPASHVVIAPKLALCGPDFIDRRQGLATSEIPEVLHESRV